MHSLKYKRSPILGYQDIGYRKSEFVAKSQLLNAIILIKQKDFKNIYKDKKYRPWYIM